MNFSSIEGRDKFNLAELRSRLRTKVMCNLLPRGQKSDKQFMKKLFKWTIACCLLGVLGVLLHLNVALYYQPTIIWQNSQAVNKDVLRQLTFLKKYLKAGGGKEMQRIFPEGFVFMHALYGMAWYETAKSLTPHSPVLREPESELIRKTAAWPMN